MTPRSSSGGSGHGIRAARKDSARRSRCAGSLKMRPFHAELVSKTASPRRNPKSKTEILAWSFGTYWPLTWAISDSLLIRWSSVALLALGLLHARPAQRLVDGGGPGLAGAGVDAAHDVHHHLGHGRAHARLARPGHHEALHHGVLLR